MSRPCWCGHSEVEPFSDDYQRCAHCETLVSTFEHATDVSRVREDTSDFYGRDYWFGHMENDLGFANIYARARADLSDRCPHWLRTVLKYATPPARVIELGSAHGGFVAMLRWAGFDATGLELSPSIAGIARELFQVPMLEGPIEDQAIAPASVDFLVLMDVLEHLPDPRATMRWCLEMLKPGGFLLIQTPKYPGGKTLEAMRADHDPFVELLQPREHLYLFSARAVEELFAGLGAPHVAFEPALFSHYDMFFAVSHQPLRPLASEARDEALQRTPSSRLIDALLTLRARLDETVPRDAFDRSEADRADRLAVITQQAADLSVWQGRATMAEHDASALRTAFDASEADRAARLSVIEAQGDRAGHDQQRLGVLEQEAGALRSALEASEADRAARLAIIMSQGDQLGHAQHHIGELEQKLAATEAEHAARSTVFETQAAEISQSRERLADADRELVALRQRLDEAERLAARGVVRHIADRVSPRPSKRSPPRSR